MIGWLIGALIGAAATAAVVVALSDDVREAIAAWLRATNRSESELMNAVLKLDQVGVKYRASIQIGSAGAVPMQISERDYSLDEIDNPVMRRQLVAAGRAQMRVLDFLNS